MSDFKAKMDQNRFRLGSLQCSPDPLAGFKGPYYKGKGDIGREGKGEREGKAGEGKKGREG